MSKSRLVIIIGCLAVVIAGAVWVAFGTRQRLVSIGTGSVTGVYYPAGGALADLVNRKKDTYGFSISVQSTGGSVVNINSLLAGDMEFGIAQSDRQYQAVKGLAEWKEGGPRGDLRAVCSLHPEMVTLVAAVDAGINSLADLRGKRVNIGNPGSGQRGNALDVLRAAGLDPAADIQAESLKAAEQAQELQDGKIDAFFFTVGHPAGSITEATAGRRKVHFVPITGMDELIKSAPYYTTASIPIKLYPDAGNTADVPTIGVMTTVVTAAGVSDDVVYALTKELFENLDEFKGKHPAFGALTKRGMLRGLFAPVHAGAMRYYKEAGLDSLLGAAAATRPSGS